MSYETLDAIADSYIPLLFFLLITVLLSTLYKLWPNWKLVTAHLQFLMGLLVISYGLMFLDSVIGIWPHFGLDYSTHTAVALALVFSLCTLIPGKRMWLAISFVAYALLMLYQAYHSVADIVSTVFVVGIFSLLLFTVLPPSKE